jgi:hypothetical protein
MCYFRFSLAWLVALSTPLLGASLLQNGSFEDGSQLTAVTDGSSQALVNIPNQWNTDVDFRATGKGWTGLVHQADQTLPGHAFPYDQDGSNKFLVFTSLNTRFTAAPDTPELWNTASLFQEFDTEPGNSYVVGFDLGAAQRSAADPTVGVNLILSNVQSGVLQTLASETFTWTASAFATSPTEWAMQRVELNFTATGTRTRLTLQDMTRWTAGSPESAIIDNVTVDLFQSIPEPTSSLLAALPCLALLRRRRTS